MSRHRIKNIDYDNDDYDEDEDDYEDDELSPEDREQMHHRTIEVRELLASQLPPVPASDEDIWESLWHYYYDVDKTVAYLRSGLSYLFLLRISLCYCIYIYIYIYVSWSDSTKRLTSHYLLVEKFSPAPSTTATTTKKQLKSEDQRKSKPKGNGK